MSDPQVKKFKRFKNRMRAKITVQVANRPMRTWWITLVVGMAIGWAGHFLFIILRGNF